MTRDELDRTIKRLEEHPEEVPEGIPMPVSAYGSPFPSLFPEREKDIDYLDICTGKHCSKQEDSSSFQDQVSRIAKDILLEAMKNLADDVIRQLSKTKEQKNNEC